ncbi:lipoprotein signal peptidase [Actinomycetota bacterium]|nr:lipoprotein signal peptidase [Actinomycetota bacterium]
MSTTHDAEPFPVPREPGASDPGAGPAPAIDVDPGPAPARRRLLVALVSITVGVFVVDQLAKQWALTALTEGERTPVLGDLLGLQLLFNPGAALGIATGMTWVLTLVACGVVVFIVRASRRLGSRGWAVALGLLLGGALGNLLDRLVRDPGFGRGHVVDFIAYADFFVGNVADIAIVAAAALIMLLALRGVRIDGTRELRAPAPAPADQPHDESSADV